jgi:outer membrane protein assembly factor BamD|tara:strand:+ start:2816 stop:3649 length:834 start_codon:yes stop_codon:yes gene_type:complete
MHIFYKLLVIVILINLQSCAKKEEKELPKITQLNQELELVTTYKEALDNLKNGDPYYAAEKFLQSELAYPQSIWAPKSALMAAYSYYLQENYSESKFQLERFIKTYPSDKNLVYAHYLIAICHYEIIVDEKKDLAPLLESKKKFNYLIKNYPNTEFARDSSYKIDLINEILASKEMYIGRFYLQKKKWIPAVNRFKNILDHYKTSIYTEEAVHRLVEIYYRLGLIEESKKYATILGYNYASSEWYKKSYALFNQKYEEPTIKKDRKKLRKKFKSLFE